MNSVLRLLKQKPLTLLLVVFPVTAAGSFLGWNATVLFILSALAVIPLAGLIGDGTENLAMHTGPKMGGLINATLGNAAELIITLLAINKGLLELVKASITGSIIGNLLFVLGLSILVGGAKNGVQKFDRRHTVNNSILLSIALLGLIIPSLFSHSTASGVNEKVETLSLCVAVVMIGLYSLGILFSFVEKKNEESIVPVEALIEHGAWSVRKSLLILALATGGIVWMSEILVGSVEAVVAGSGISEFFVGIILVPIIGNVAEHLVAINMAIKNKMELSMEIAISSSLQIALFVAPVLVFISLLFGNPLNLVFNPFELAALMSAVIVTYFVSADGESNWLEGAALIAVYIIFGLAFFIFPS
ncbi:MAG TPA: calcium/proton exchanger [Anaerolineaceae bacterium]|nr:calcium/proton exchanger [Anaerolineaceae bacterium]